jgi:hypothetical protein
MTRQQLPDNLLDNLMGGTVSIRSQLKYDYSLIPAGQREAIQAAAVDIIKAGRQAQQSLIDIGQKLIAVKDVLEHGQFEDWCNTEFQMSSRTVQNMMNVARAFDGKSEIISLLSDTALYALAAPSTPEAARDQVIAEAQAAGAPPKVERVKAVIAAHKPQPSFADVSRIERVVCAVIEERWPDTPETLSLAFTLRAAKAGSLFVKDVEFALDEQGIEFRGRDLKQAISNVAAQIEQRVLQTQPPPSASPEQRQYASAVRFIELPPPHVIDLKPAAAPPAPAPNTLPADLAARGWELRQVPGSGRWYCNNRSGPRATGISDKPADAIAEAYTMQRDLRGPQVVEVEAVRELPPRPAKDLMTAAAAGLDAAIRQMQVAYGYVDGWDMDWCKELSDIMDDVLRLRQELTA